MKNKEYTLKYLNEHTDELYSFIQSNGCLLCEKIGCKKYCHEDQEHGTCYDTLVAWMNMERNPLNLKVGDIVEIAINPYTRVLRYFIGSELKLMYFAKTKEEYELAKKVGAIHYPRKCELTTLHVAVLEKHSELIRKVGEVND